MISINNGSKSISLKGVIEKIPSKRGFRSIETIYGQKKQEITRFVFELSIKVDYIDNLNYESLMDMFANGDSLFISDITQGGEFVDYTISGDSLSLLKNEDVERKEYYFSGNLALHKI